jgi:hypothetical protein
MSALCTAFRLLSLPFSVLMVGMAFLRPLFTRFAVPQRATVVGYARAAWIACSGRSPRLGDEQAVEIRSRISALEERVGQLE